MDVFGLASGNNESPKPTAPSIPEINVELLDKAGEIITKTSKVVATRRYVPTLEAVKKVVGKVNELLANTAQLDQETLAKALTL